MNEYNLYLLLSRESIFMEKWTYAITMAFPSNTARTNASNRAEDMLKSLYDYVVSHDCKVSYQVEDVLDDAVLCFKDEGARIHAAIYFKDLGYDVKEYVAAS